jgi:hypothetical protein
MRIPLPTVPEQSSVYPDWVRSSQTTDVAAQVARAEELIAYVRAWLKQPKSPDRYFTDLEERISELPPEHMPWFWDNVGHLQLPGWPASGAYRRARQAERDHGLPTDIGHCIDNALLFTHHVGLTDEEMRPHLQRLQEELKPAQAHHEFARFLRCWAAHNYLAPAEDLHELIRASAGAAGLGMEEDSGLLGELLVSESGWRATESLLQGVAKVFAQAPPEEPILRGLLTLFTRTQTKTNGKGLLQVLKSSGAMDAMCAGRIVPEGGCAGWLSQFVHHYSYYFVLRSGTVRSQPMPAELYALLPALAGRIRAEGTAVRLHENQYRHKRLDAYLADACLELGIPVEDPGSGVYVDVPARPSRDYTALRDDPVIGPRLGGRDVRPRSRFELS